MATIQTKQAQNQPYTLKLLKGTEIVDGKPVFTYETYTLTFVPLRMTREALIVRKEIEEMYAQKEVDEVEALEKQVAFVATVFGISTDEILDGLDASIASLEIKRLFDKVLGNEEVEKDEQKKMEKLAKLMK